MIKLMACRPAAMDVHCLKLVPPVGLPAHRFKLYNYLILLIDLLMQFNDNTPPPVGLSAHCFIFNVQLFNLIYVTNAI